MSDGHWPSMPGPAPPPPPVGECGRCVWVEDGPLRVCTLPAGHEGKCSDGEAAWLHTRPHGEKEADLAELEPSCTGCRYFEDYHCFRYPPGMHVDDHGQMRLVRPYVGADDWCGEFEAKK